MSWTEFGVVPVLPPIMDDQELAAIRASRLRAITETKRAFLQSLAKLRGGDAEAAAAQRGAEEEMKRTIIAQILEPARQRTSYVSSNMNACS